MAKFCINCNMGDPLPHDQRIGQLIYNYLRTDNVIESHDDHIKDQSIMADRLFNIDDSKIKQLFYDKLWCNKCKARNTN